MQAETTAVKICAEEMINSNVSGRNIFIFSDSQATIKAISKSTISTTTVKECVDKLNFLGKSNTLTISWVPVHSGVLGYEIADELANEGTELEEIGIIKPSPDSIKNTRTKRLGRKMLKDLSNRLKHSKILMEPFKKGKDDLIKMKSKYLRVIIGMLTGHSCLRKFLNRIGKANSAYCRYCQEDEDEDMNHVLTNCPAFARIRLSTGGKAFLSEVKLKNVNILNLLKFAKLSNVYETFLRDQEI